MSGFDTTLNVIGINIPEIEDETQTELEVILVIGILLPFSAGPGQGPIPAPLGNLRFRVTREDAINIGKIWAERAEKLAKPSDITVATDLGAVEQVARADQQIRGQGGQSN